MPIFKAPNGDTFRTDEKQQEDWLEISEQELLLHLQTRATQASFADLKAIEVASYIETREKMCARVAGIGQRLARAGDTVGATSCDAVVNALLDVLAHPTVAGAADIVSLRLALKTRYVAAVSLASTSARNEFKRYDK